MTDAPIDRHESAQAAAERLFDKNTEHPSRKREPHTAGATRTAAVEQ